jgi:hypothetical protein
MITPRAVGLICLPLVPDPAAAENRLRALAEGNGLDLAEIVCYRPDDVGWVLRMLEAVNRYRATAVLAPEVSHVADAIRAVTGAADLITPAGTVPYVGYSTPGVRPGDPHPHSEQEAR